jgi:hypothetical protein
MAHACSSSYSRGRDQEDPGLKPAQTNSSARPYLEKPFTKIGLVEWLKVKAMSSSPSTEYNERTLGYSKVYPHITSFKGTGTVPCKWLIQVLFLETWDRERIECDRN